VGKIAEKAVCKSVIFDNMALYFQCRISKSALQTVFFGDFCPLKIGIFVTLNQYLISVSFIIQYFKFIILKSRT